MTPSDWKRWKQDSVTEAFFQSLAREKKELEAAICDGQCLGVSCEEIAVKYAQRTGEKKGLTVALEHVPEWAREDGESE